MRELFLFARPEFGRPRLFENFPSFFDLWLPFCAADFERRRPGLPELDFWVPPSFLLGDDDSDSFFSLGLVKKLFPSKTIWGGALLGLLKGREGQFFLIC